MSEKALDVALFMFSLGQCFRIERAGVIRLVPGQEYILFERGMEVIFHKLTPEQYADVLMQICHTEEAPMLPPYRGDVLAWFKANETKLAPLSSAVLVSALHNVLAE
jgi:hypothetical protein